MRLVCVSIVAMCQQQDRGGRAEAWPWSREYLHVHFARGDYHGMSLGVYTAVIASAMVSFFTGR